MRVQLIAIGRLKAGPERDLCARYLDRFAKIGPALGLELGKGGEVPESRASDTVTRKREEASGLSRLIPDNAYVVLLDERGKSLGSEDLAGLLADERDGGRRDFVFVIGGADGHDEALRQRAGLIVSFGRATWPHQLARIMASEQLYRMATILAGHPYHRG